MTTKKPATALPYIYGAGTRLSSAYTAGFNSEPHAKHFGGMSSAATKAWLTGKAERERLLQVEKDRRANAYPRLVAELKRLCVEIPRQLGSDTPFSNDLLRELGELE